MSKAFALFSEGVRTAGWPVVVINIAEPGRTRRAQAFSVARALSSLRAVIRAWLALPSCEVLYLTISQARLAFIRDSLVLFAARLLRRCTIVHMHGGNFDAFYSSQPKLFRFLIRASLWHSARIVVLSDLFRHHFAMLPRWRERTVTVFNASDVPVLTPRKAPGDTCRVLFLSTLMVEKGYRDVLESLCPLSAAAPGRRFEFHFAGDFALGTDPFPGRDAMRKDFERLAAAAPNQMRVIWHGAVDGEAKLALLRLADVFVLPTYYRNEGQPIAIIEALRSGLPVIATPHRAIPELLPQQMHELFVAERSPAAIASRLSRLATDRDFYEDLSRRAIQRASVFDLRLHQQTLLGIIADAYRSVVRGRVASNP